MIEPAQGPPQARGSVASARVPAFTVRWRHWALLGILLLAFGLRIYRLGADSLWYDETVSVHLAGKNLSDLVAHTAGDIHPPGYYLLLHAWTRLAGDSSFAVAFPSLFFGLLLVPLAYWLGTRIFGHGAGLLAAFLIAISPYNLWYSQEVRMYTLGAALGMILFAATLRLLSRSLADPFFSSTPSPWLLLAVYVLCGALGLWALYYFAFLLLAINLLVGLWWLVAGRRGTGWPWLGRWILAQAALLLLYAPWIPTAWRQATDPPVPPWRAFVGLGRLMVETWSALGLGQSVEPLKVWPLLLLFALLFGLGLIFRPLLRVPRDWSLRWILAGYLFLPLLFIYLASFMMALYHVRYAFTYSTPFYVIVAAGLAWLWQRWRVLAAVALALILAFSGIAIRAYHADPRYAADDHRAAVHFLAERWRPGDAILVNAGYAYTALLAYWDDPLAAGEPIAWRGRLVEDYSRVLGSGPVVLQTGTVDGDPSLGWGDPESDFYAMSRAETSAALERLFGDFDRVWVYRIYDTVTDPEGYIRRWLDEHGTQFEERVFTGEGQLRVQGFLTTRDPLTDADRAYDSALADGSLILLAGSALPDRVEVGGALDLALVWHAAQPPAGATPAGDHPILFVGLFDGEGQRWGQVDERPMGSLYPVGDWPEGAIVRTPLRLVVPPGTPPGFYRIEMGWYRFVDGQPVWLPWNSGNRLLLGEMEIVAPMDWGALPLPLPDYPAGVEVGEGVRLLGFDVPQFEGNPGGTLALDLYWQALIGAPGAGPAVLYLADDAGQVLARVSSAPVGGQAPFAGLGAGQVVRDPRSLALPGDLEPGVYNLLLGRQLADGTWLPVRRGPFPLGSTYPLATIRVLDRSLDLTPPTVQNPMDARFGDSIRFIGYDLDGAVPTLYWQALAPMDKNLKIFLHFVADDRPSDVRAQVDSYPHLPTTAWLPGEFLSDRLDIDLPSNLPAGRYELLLGLYDERTGERLPVYDDAGAALGDSLLLQEIPWGE